MNEWTDEQIRKWVLHKCWIDNQENPGRPGLFLNEEKLEAGSPPLERIAEAVNFLQDEEQITGEIGRAFLPNKHGKVSHILNLKLTAKGIKEIQAQSAP